MSAKPSKFMNIETWSVKKKAIMGRSMTDLPVHSPRQNLSYAQNPLVTVTIEAASVTHREKEVCLGTHPRNTEIPKKIAGVFIEGIMEDCDEDGGEGSDPPNRSFIRRRLDEQSRQVEHTVSQKMNSLLEVIRNNSDTHTKLLELLVSRAFEGGPTNQS
ncbi:hypothetical protein TB1_029101 [Malus domestica]